MIWSISLTRVVLPRISRIFPKLGSPVPLHSLQSAAAAQKLFPCASKTFTTSAKDVLLFKFDKPKFYKYINVFAVVQFLFWAFIGKYSVSTMRDVPVEENASEDLPWWKKINLGEAQYKYSLAAVCYFFGFAVLGISWLFTLRSVRYLVLSKGGDKISLVTYTPFGENRILTVPLDKVSCLESRIGSKSTLPMRVDGHKLYYLLDMRGEFRNPQLFDRTAGVKRKL